MFQRQWLQDLVVPVTLYDPHSSPFPGNLVTDICPELSGYGSFIIASIANEVGAKAYTNPARMYCYNLLVQNYFNNPDIAEVAGYICKAVILGIRKNQYSTNEQAIAMEVPRVLSMYTSALLFRFDELKSSCPPNAVNAAYQNVQQFNSFKQEIDTMNQFVTQPVYYPHPVMGQQPMMPQGAVMYPSGHMGVPVGYPMQPAPGPNYSGMNSGMVHPGAMNHNYRPPVESMRMEQNSAPISTTSRYGSATPSGGRFGNEGDMDRIPVNISQSRFHQPDEQFQQRTQPNQRVEQMQKPNAVVPKSFSYLDIEGGSEMDREKHQIVTIGRNAVVNIKDKFHKLAVSVDAFITDREGFVTDCDDSFCSVSLTEFINNIRVKRLITDKTKKSAMFFGRGLIADIVHTVTNDPNGVYGELNGELRSCKAFTEVAAVLRKYAMRIADTTSEEDKAHIYDVVTVIDKKLTDSINEFIKFDLRKNNLSITEFSSDLSEMEEIISNKLGIEYYQAYRTFQETTMQGLFDNSDEHHEMIMSNIGYDTTDGMLYTALTSEVGILLVDMTSTEFGFKFGDGSNIIRRDKFPTLDKLVNKLWNDGYYYDRILMVTKDDVIYNIRRDYLKSGEFAISLYK